MFQPRNAGRSAGSAYPLRKKWVPDDPAYKSRNCSVLRHTHFAKSGSSDVPAYNTRNCSWLGIPTSQEVGL